MNYKTNRLNHDFQILHFIVGDCHTADGAYGILSDLRDDRTAALKSYEVAQLRSAAKAARARAAREAAETSEADRLEAQADLEEIHSAEELNKKNHAAAVAELAFIEKCIEAVGPHRKFRHLPDPEAHEAAQAEEWKLELIRRAENHLLTSGTIPADHFSTMRLHPAFLSEILPTIEGIRRLIGSEGGIQQLLQKISQRHFDLRKLLDMAGKPKC